MTEFLAPIDEYIRKVPTPLYDTCNELIRIVTGSFPDLDYAIKWSQLTFAVNKDFHHWLFALKATKRSINIVFHFGGILEDPGQLLIRGESFFFRKLEYSDPGQIDKDALIGFIGQAISRLDYFKNNWKSIRQD